jgi:hypothetical protein
MVGVTGGVGGDNDGFCQAIDKKPKFERTGR